MKKINIIIAVLVLFGSSVFAQTAYNPFTQNIHFEPEPIPAGFPCGSTQTVAFTQGLTTAADATQWANNPLTVIICLTGFTYSGSASSVVFGSYAANFDWAYDSFAPNCIIGTQKQTLPGTGSDPIFPNPLSSGDIKLTLTVPETSPIGTILAVNVNLQVPGYMSQFNSTPDDNESTQTQTYCELKISGTIYNDTDTNNVSVNGTPIQTPDGTPLHISLVGPNGLVVATSPIAANGTYEFLNVTGNTNYTTVLTTTPGVVGSATPVVDLPALWVNTGEDCCDKTGNDGIVNGINAVSVTNASKINVDFGIRKPGPTGGLPTVLTNFFVSEYNCHGLLSWTTAQEHNASHVEINRKEANGVYRTIATVQAAGNSTTAKNYSYIDKEVSKDGAYEYELKFVDIDGTFTVSDIKTLKLNCVEEVVSVNISPNPTSNDLNLTYITEEAQVELFVEVMDVTGRKLMSTSQMMKSGVNKMTWNIAPLATGAYFLHYHDADGYSEGSIKFIKQ